MMNVSVAAAAAIKLSLRNRTLPMRAAANTKIANRLVLTQFKRDQSTEILKRRFIVSGGTDALRGSAMAARTSSIDERANDGSCKTRNTSRQASSPAM